jgi:glycerate 2-kinase
MLAVTSANLSSMALDEAPRHQYLRNRDVITGHGSRALRSVAADIVEHALAAADPYIAVKQLLSLKGDQLVVGDLSFDLGQYEDIYILGAGKASLPVAEALEEVLGERITAGLFVLKYGCGGSLRRSRIVYAAHPVPDEAGLQGAQEMMALARRCTERDLVFAAISGGSSALLPLPVDGLTLADKQVVNRLLLFCGADITEINAVRKHLSRIKGGWLAKEILPATLINLTVSDVVGDALDYITDPTVPDTSTFEDAQQVLDRYGLWEAFPSAARDYLRSGDATNETPKDFGRAPLHTFVVVDSTAACLGAAARAAELGYKPMVLTTMLKGEARDAGTMFAAIAREIASYGRPTTTPCAIIAGGENTVTIRGDHGKGGPNQVFALSAALDIAGLSSVVVVAVDTDGTDGPTEYAGGMVDGSTIMAARSQGLDVFAAIRNHNTAPLLVSIGDAVITGHTGTNVNDLKLMLVD